MKQLPINMLHIIALCLMIPNLVHPRLTTLKHFDPAPNYNANDSMVPPNSQFLNLKKARIKDEQPNKQRFVGFNISGFFQKAVRARGYNGNTEYGTVNGSAANAFELGDFRGTMNIMGLFLGQNPDNKNYIYNHGTCPTDKDYVTPCSIQTFYGQNNLECLQNIALGLIQYGTTSGSIFIPTCPSGSLCPDPSSPTINPLQFYQTPTNSVCVGTSNTAPISIFDANALAQDTTYFGAFSVPITYQQAGLRLELNINFWDYVGITVQSGMSNMRQNYVNTIPALAQATNSGTTTTFFTNGQTAPGPYSLSAIPNTTATSTTISNTIANLYGNLILSSDTTPPPHCEAQAAFDQYVSNNLAQVLNPDCLGSDPICAFEKNGFDDVRIIANFQKTYEPFRMRHEEDDDAGNWPDVLFTPYAWVGGSVPTGDQRNYRNILSLPFGNDGHASVGGGGGFLFDFAESVEVGFEGGVTYFTSKTKTIPFPTHQLQRVLYPFDATVDIHPGMNWDFTALLNCYQFIKHVSFWFTYEMIEHKKDCYTIKDKTKAAYYVPEVLTCRSDWRAQFFNAAVVFDIMPGAQFSFVWQQPISPRNAYYPVTIMGSLNFLF
jgi:hypothetical protein